MNSDPGKGAKKGEFTEKFENEEKRKTNIQDEGTKEDREVN